MRNFGSIAVLLSTAALVACGQAPNVSAAAEHRGRYHGIGTYAAGRMWSRMVAADRPASSAAAGLADDEQVIVVVDSQTGEVRQCGNLTGHCIGMNPWSAPLGQGQGAPVNLTEHAADLDRADETEPPAASEDDRNAASAADERARPDRR